MSQNITKDSFYKQRLFNRSHYQLQTERTLEEKYYSLIRSESSQKKLDVTLIEKSLSDFNKTANGYSYAFLQFKCINQEIENISALNQFIHLQYIDLSNNKIKTLKSLSQIKYLSYINVSKNNLSFILDFKQIPYCLDEANFGYNNIQYMSDLSKHRFLRKLNVEHNKIRRITGVSQNKNLKELNLSNNLIEDIENLDNMELISLNLSNNRIIDIKGLNKLPKLRTLDLSSNQISKLLGLSQLYSLRDITLANNKIRKIKEIKNLEVLRSLTNLDLCFNFIQNKRYYRYQILYRLSILRNLDGTDVNPQQVIKACNLFGEDREERQNIFKNLLPQQMFIDRRIHVSQFIEEQSESDGQDLQLIDKYDDQGKMISSSVKSKSRSSKFTGMLKK